MATYSNLFIDQGSDFSFTVDLSAEDISRNLNTYTAREHINRNIEYSPSEEE